MQLKPIIQGLAVVWLLLFVVSFITLQLTAVDDSTGGLNRVVSFLTWQAAAFIVAMVGAFAARYAAQRGVERRQAVRLRAARAQRVPRRVVRCPDGLPLLDRAAVRVGAHGSSSAMTPQPVTAGSV